MSYDKARIKDLNCSSDIMGKVPHDYEGKAKNTEAFVGVSFVLVGMDRLSSSYTVQVLPWTQHFSLFDGLYILVDAPPFGQPGLF